MGVHIYNVLVKDKITMITQETTIRNELASKV